MDIEMTAGSGKTDAVVGLDPGNPLEALADSIGEALGLSPEAGSAFTPPAAKAPQWQIEAGQ